MLGFLGDLIGGYFGYKGQQDTNSANRQIAEENRSWQQHMSNTAYRRSMRDMEKSGLNPILAYQQGGASTPAGSVIPMENPAKDASSIGRAISDRLLQAKRAEAEINNLNSNSALNSEKVRTEKSNQQANIASAAYTSAQTVTEGFRPENVQQDTWLKRNQTELAAFQSSIASNTLTIGDAEAAKAFIQKQITEGTFGNLLGWMERLNIDPGQLIGRIISRTGGKPGDILKLKNTPSAYGPSLIE